VYFACLAQWYEAFIFSRIFLAFFVASTIACILAACSEAAFYSKA